MGVDRNRRGSGGGLRWIIDSGAVGVITADTVDAVVILATVFSLLASRVGSSSTQR